MGLFDFFNKGKKEKEHQEQLHLQQEADAKRKAEEQRGKAEAQHREEERKRQMQTTSPNATNIFSKTELESLIQILSRISYIFQRSERLIGGRNEKMMSRTHSYAGILGYYYENEYHYGKMADIVDSKIASHYILVEQAMRNAEHRKRTVKELADNWSDVLQVIYNLQLDSNTAGDKFKTMEADIKKVLEAFERLSGTKCKKPINPLNVSPKNATYNPFGITEDLMRSQGHLLPDFTNVFAQELIPLMINAQHSGMEQKDIVANYAIAMIKSYYDNAGFVPMIIVDQITGQINQVAEMVQRVSYAPCNTLKEYVLSKIYR